MAYKIQFRMDEDIPCFEIVGSIGNHLDSIATCVRYRIAGSRTQRVLLDLRNATGRPCAARVFNHVLKYPPTGRIDCAVIHGEQSCDFLELYAKLMRHRGHRIQLFARVDEGMEWLLGAAASIVPNEPVSISRRLFQSIRDACSVHAKGRSDVHASVLR